MSHLAYGRNTEHVVTIYKIDLHFDIQPWVMGHVRVFFIPAESLSKRAQH